MDGTIRKFFESPVGTLEIASRDGAIVRVGFADKKAGGEKAACECVDRCITELREYFEGKRKKFTVRVRPEGTKFQVAVWRELSKIPYGETVSYQDIAARVGNPKAARAVGMANNRNPVAIIIPCHRVIGKNGGMVGYATGLWKKELLLSLERGVKI